MQQNNKITQLVKEFVDDFNSIAGGKAPVIKCAITSGGWEEEFQAFYSQGIVQINAKGPLAAAYGVSQLSSAWKAGFLGEYLGDSTPYFFLRPVWVDSGVDVFINGLTIQLPCFMANSELNQRNTTGALFCRRLIELGYNAVMVGPRGVTQTALKSGTIEEACEFIALMHQYGLKVIIKPTLVQDASGKQPQICPLNASYQKRVASCLEALCQTLPVIDFIFWESSLLHEEYSNDLAAKDSTTFEIVATELSLIEQSLPPKISLIFYVPVKDTFSATQQASWLSRLCDEAGNRTILSFSAVAGELYDDHLAPHPFWEELRKSPDISFTHLMPLVNVGMVFQGEGLWPSLTCDLVEKYYTRLYRHRFAGVMALANRLPKQGSILDCSLWVAGQYLWRPRAPASLVELWFRAHRPEWCFQEMVYILEGARQLVIELSTLRTLISEFKKENTLSEECRVVTESMFSRLKNLLLQAEKIERKKTKRSNLPSILDYLQVFARDAQRIILHYLQCFNLSYPHMLGPEELLDSFWMKLSQGANHGIRSSGKLLFTNEPHSGPAGSKMEAIFFENRLI